MPKVHSAIKSWTWLFLRSERLLLELESLLKNVFQPLEENDSKELLPEESWKLADFFSTSSNQQLDVKFPSY